MLSFLKNKYKERKELKTRETYFDTLNKKLYTYIYLSPTSLWKRKPLGLASQNKSPLAMYDFTVDIDLGEYTIKYIHQVRGSLISICKGSDVVLEWVDQTRQYSGWLGVNDVKNDLTAVELKELNLLLDEYLSDKL